MSEQWFREYVLLAFRIDKAIRKFSESRFVDYYIFTYFYGKRLMQPWLQSADRLAVFRRFLTEQLYPAELVKEEIS